MTKPGFFRTQFHLPLKLPAGAWRFLSYYRGGFVKPEWKDASGAAALYRAGIAERAEFTETDRFRGVNNSHRYRFFWKYRLTPEGRQWLALAAGTQRAETEGLSPKDARAAPEEGQRPTSVSLAIEDKG